MFVGLSCDYDSDYYDSFQLNISQRGDRYQLKLHGDAYPSIAVLARNPFVSISPTIGYATSVIITRIMRKRARETKKQLLGLAFVANYSTSVDLATIARKRTPTSPSIRNIFHR